jgi:hypothetical protein
LPPRFALADGRELALSGVEGGPSPQENGKKNPASREAGFLLLPPEQLEDELQRKLQNASVVDCGDVEELASAQTIVSSAARRSSVSSYATPLCVIEDIVSLRPEFEGRALFDREVFEQGHIEIGATWVAQHIPARVSEG